jgi:hypothetical protein
VEDVIMSDVPIGNDATTVVATTFDKSIQEPVDQNLYMLDVTYMSDTIHMFRYRGSHYVSLKSVMACVGLPKASLQYRVSQVKRTHAKSANSYITVRINSEGNSDGDLFLLGVSFVADWLYTQRFRGCEVKKHFRESKIEYVKSLTAFLDSNLESEAFCVVKDAVVATPSSEKSTSSVGHRPPVGIDIDMFAADISQQIACLRNELFNLMEETRMFNSAFMQKLSDLASQTSGDLSDKAQQRPDSMTISDYATITKHTLSAGTPSRIDWDCSVLAFQRGYEVKAVQSPVGSTPVYPIDVLEEVFRRVKRS